jgi:hypothetical protein
LDDARSVRQKDAFEAEALLQEMSLLFYIILIIPIPTPLTPPPSTNKNG